MILALRRLIRRYVFRPLALARHRPVLGEIYEAYDAIAVDFVRSHGLIYAAAIAFYTLLSAIPLLILLASLAGYVLYSLGDAESVESILAQLMDQIHKAVPFMAPGLERDMTRMVEARGKLGLVGGLTLLLSASQVFRALEFAFARIFARRKGVDIDDRDTRPRSFVLSKLISGAFLVAIVGVFVVVRIGLELLESMVSLLPKELTGFVTELLDVRWIVSELVFGAFVVAGFTMVVKFFSSHRVKIRYGLVGGLVFTVAWQFTQKGFAVWLENFSNLGALYGGFSALMATIVWVFTSAVLLLICGHIVKLLQWRFTFGPRYTRGGRGWERRRRLGELTGRAPPA